MENKSVRKSGTTREFTLQFLKQITDNFSEERIIGRGGYGVVYKGVLEDGEEIAVKKLYRVPGLDDKQFTNEFNNLLRAQHQNIVRLIGYCYYLGHQRIKHKGDYIFAHVEERALCFEYLQGGSLDKHICDESSGLDWHTRYKIIKGVSEGLNYLHNGSKHPIYHLDLKPGNILLDKDLMPKIGDFGLSRLFPSAQTRITIKTIGTPGYMPPEYIDRHQITSKFDVFSLGVIIIKIMAGHAGYSKLADMPSQEFIKLVHVNWLKKLLVTMSSHTSQQVKTCIEVAVRCVESDRAKRPTIAEIVHELYSSNAAKIIPICKDQNPSFKDLLSSEVSENLEGVETQITQELPAEWGPEGSPSLVSGLDNANPPADLPIVFEEPSSFSEDEAAEDDLLPAVEELQISCEAFPGREIDVTGYSINGTTGCNFQWVRHLKDGPINFIEGATQPTYLVTADDVDSVLAVEVQPLDDRGRKGNIVKVYANEQTNITCDPKIKELIKEIVSIGHVSYEVLLSLKFLDMRESAVLVIKKEGFSIKLNGQHGVVIAENFQQNTAINIPYGCPTEFSIQSVNGAEFNLMPAENAPSRDTIVLVLRVFRMLAVRRLEEEERHVLGVVWSKIVQMCCAFQCLQLFMS